MTSENSRLVPDVTDRTILISFSEDRNGCKVVRYSGTSCLKQCLSRAGTSQYQHKIGLHDSDWLTGWYDNKDGKHTSWGGGVENRQEVLEKNP